MADCKNQGVTLRKFIIRGESTMNRLDAAATHYDHYLSLSFLFVVEIDASQLTRYICLAF
jgi:hypothetical protein